VKKVVIIGGGFSGVVTAVNLARLTDAPLAVTVVNTSHPLGRGVAYGTRRPEHLLNVVARNMSALADQPNHFVDWLQTRSDFGEIPLAELRESFIPRRVYGDYLQALFLWYSHALADGKQVVIDRVAGEAVDVIAARDDVTVRLADGAVLPADKVILATGNQAPTDLPGLVVEHPQYYRDPWGDWDRRLPDPALEIVLLGTGLTMLDAFLNLEAIRWHGKVYAVSRNGLLPVPHFKGPDYPAFPEGDPTRLTLDELLVQFRTHRDRLQAQGLNPAILVDRLRPWTQRLWQHFSLAEKRRFLSEFRTRWNVRRHRAPQVAHAKLIAAIEAGHLEVVKGRISEIEASCGGLQVIVQQAIGRPRTLRAGAVVNCTGPADGYPGDSELYRKLLQRGLVSLDEASLGIRAATDFVALDANGSRSAWLLVLGPPLKGMLWESTAVPELRAQAFRVAEIIVADTHAKRAAVRAVPETYADVLEYTI
jgi:uncharacterized NAD(P)/FAD-binding protein YdhS